ncbi:hypothetical protein ACQ4M4_21260 [Leptolyngbya sp. AN02str]|uniref:hypothetical protein n=1 Tax=Leptolyngbya sp. AN02str TaxID=3423363 RepID=UPI003D324222
MRNLTEDQAFEAMVLFLEQFYERTKSDDVAVLLGQLIILEGGGTADPAVWHDWIECLHQVLNKE